MAPDHRRTGDTSPWERPTLISDSPQECYLCGGAISPGDRYVRIPELLPARMPRGHPRNKRRMRRSPRHPVCMECEIEQGWRYLAPKSTPGDKG